MNQLPDFTAHFLGRHFRRVKPQEVNAPVLRKQFLQLRNDLPLHVGGQLLGVFIGIIPRIASSCLHRPVGRYVRVFPIASQRIIETEFQSFLPACLGQFLHGIFTPRGTFHDVVVAALGIVHGKAVVMLGSNNDITHARPASVLRPLAGVELRRIEIIGYPRVLLQRNTFVQHEVFSSLGGMSFPIAGGLRVESPVQEQSEFGIPEPSQRGGISRLRIGHRYHQTSQQGKAGTFQS